MYIPNPLSALFRTFRLSQHLLSKKELSNFRKRCVSNYNKEKGTDYNHFDWILSRQVDYIERLRMKLIGIVFELIRKEII